MINTVVEFIRGKNVKPSCKKLSDDTLFTDFNTASDDETTISSARSTVENKRPVEEFINEWKEQHDAIVRNKNKEKQKEMMEKSWGEYFLPPSKQQKDPETSSVILYDSNITETSTNQKEQVTSYEHPTYPK